jgi:drug/metabolite transporter (DMT)-like permease
MSRTESADSLVFWVLTMMAVFSSVLGVRDWQPIPTELWGWIGVVGITGAIAQQCITRAFMLAPASVIAPFEYTALVWGALFDWLAWSTHPSLATALGAVLIVSSGVYVMASGGPESEPASAVTAEPHP